MIVGRTLIVIATAPPIVAVIILVLFIILLLFVGIRVVVTMVMELSFCPRLLFRIPVTLVLPALVVTMVLSFWFHAANCRSGSVQHIILTLISCMCP